ncbi:MAG: putative transcriptional regulator PhnF [Candidatus Celerinatantimonas neptuna]|nr:MAG: putative transcriptional regulator PhnF [Candidatus Celerinatantimonas neptuna]
MSESRVRYLEIAKALRESIQSDYQPGELLPAEGKLADRYQVNRHTLRRAIDELVQDGLIRRYQGIGCRVLNAPIDYALHDKAAFTHNLSQGDMSLETQVLSLQTTELPEAITHRLKLESHPAVQQLQTKRLIDHQPVSLIRHYLFDTSEEIIQEYKSGSLHVFLNERLGWSLRRGHTRLRARMPNMNECQQLDIDRSIALMEIHTQNFDRESGRLKEYSIARSRSDLFDYTLEPSSPVVEETTL